MSTPPSDGAPRPTDGTGPPSARRTLPFGVPPSLALLLLLGPVVAVVALRLPLINQLEYADAWFYSGYGWTPKHHFDVYGWNYFAVRFPAILPIGIFDKAFGAQLGYVLLRYLLTIAAGAALYVLVRRVAGQRVALAAVVLLLVNAFFSRLLLWDYSNFVVVTAGLAGVCLWIWAADRPALWSVPAGIALSIAVFANAVMGLPLLVLFLVDAVASARLGRASVGALVRRTLVGVGCGAGVFVLGYLGYVATIGGFGPDELLRPTVEFLSENDENSSIYVIPVSDWLFHEPRLWAPVLLSAGVAAALGRGVLGTDLRARIAQCLIGYTALLWIYRFTVTSAILETWWAFNVVVIFMAPAAAVLLAELVRDGEGARTRLRWLVGGAVVTALVVRLAEEPALDVYDVMATNEPVGPAVLIAGLVLCGVVVTRRHAPVGLAAAVGVLVLVNVFVWSPSSLDGRGETGVFTADANRDWDAYPAAKEIAELIRDTERPGEEILLWYPFGEPITTLAWIDLIQFGQTLNLVGANEDVDVVRPLGVGRLQQASPRVTHVLVLGSEARDVPTAQRAIAAAGFGGPRVRGGVLADGRLHYGLIQITRRPGAPVVP